MNKNYLLIWNSCLKFIKSSINYYDFRILFQPIIFYKIERKILFIQIPNNFFYRYLNKSYFFILKSMILSFFKICINVEYLILTKLYFNFFLNRVNRFFINNEFRTFNLSSNNIFNSFISDNNILIERISKYISNYPGINLFNPFLVYGNSIGKTHIIQSIGNKIKHNFINNFVFYISSEQLVNHFIYCIKNNYVQYFVSFYLKVNTLIVDDIQFLSTKSKTQEIFFYIFKYLYRKSNQIIISINSSFFYLKHFQFNFLSLFKLGFLTCIKKPNFITKIKIIKNRISFNDIFISSSVIRYISSVFSINIRNLEGIIVSLIVYIFLHKKDISINIINNILKNIINNLNIKLSIFFIQEVVSSYYGISINDLKSKSRKRNIVVARSLSIYFSKIYTDYSLKLIGNYFGGRHYSTILYSLRNFNNNICKNFNFKLSFEDIKLKIENIFFKLEFNKII